MIVRFYYTSWLLLEIEHQDLINQLFLSLHIAAFFWVGHEYVVGGHISYSCSYYDKQLFCRPPVNDLDMDHGCQDVLDLFLCSLFVAH